MPDPRTSLQQSSPPLERPRASHIQFPQKRFSDLTLVLNLSKIGFSFSQFEKYWTCRCRKECTHQKQNAESRILQSVGFTYKNTKWRTVKFSPLLYLSLLCSFICFSICKKSSEDISSEIFPGLRKPEKVPKQFTATDHPILCITFVTLCRKETWSRQKMPCRFVPDLEHNKKWSFTEETTEFKIAVPNSILFPKLLFQHAETKENTRVQMEFFAAFHSFAGLFVVCTDRTDQWKRNSLQTYSVF